MTEEAPPFVEGTESTWVASPKADEALGHWSQLIENFQTSALDYYAALEAALERRSIPGISTRRVHFAEGGMFDAGREYLRVERGELKIDVCAAPFGTGFFFSWWLAGRRPAWWLALLLAGALLLYLIWKVMYLGFGTRLQLTLLIILLVGVGIPFVQRLVKRTTYYAVDTLLMFKAAVHAAVTETIDSLLTAKGLRALTEEEKKPIMREFLTR